MKGGTDMEEKEAFGEPQPLTKLRNKTQIGRDSQKVQTAQVRPNFEHQ